LAPLFQGFKVEQAAAIFRKTHLFSSFNCMPNLPLFGIGMI